MHFRAIILMSAFSAGCVSSVSDGFESAPEWFDERREQLAGEGYPSFRQVSEMQSDVETAPWRDIEKELDTAYKEIERADLGAVKVTEADMRAWAAEQKALVAKGEEPY